MSVLLTWIQLLVLLQPKPPSWPCPLHMKYFHESLLNQYFHRRTGTNCCWKWGVQEHPLLSCILRSFFVLECTFLYVFASSISKHLVSWSNLFCFRALNPESMVLKSSHEWRLKPLILTLKPQVIPRTEQISFNVKIWETSKPAIWVSILYGTFTGPW